MVMKLYGFLSSTETRNAARKREGGSILDTPLGGYRRSSILQWQTGSTQLNLWLPLSPADEASGEAVMQARQWLASMMGSRFPRDACSCATGQFTAVRNPSSSLLVVFVAGRYRITELWWPALMRQSGSACILCDLKAQVDSTCSADLPQTLPSAHITDCWRIFVPLCITVMNLAK